MKILSPTEAVGPAFRRTREVMASPFHLGFFLKIAVVAALTQPAFISVMVSYPLQAVQVVVGSMAARHPLRSGFNAAWQPGMSTVTGVVLLAVLLLLGLFFWAAVVYLFCRLRFTLFDLIVYKQGSIRRSWIKYGSQAWRYVGVMLLASLAFFLVAAISAGPFFLKMLRAMRAEALQGSNPNPLPLLAAMLPVLVVLFLLALCWMIVDTVLQDFVLPPMALEDAPIGGAFRRFFLLLQEGPAMFLGYLLVRFVLSIGISWVLLTLVGIVLLVAGAGCGLVSLLLYRTMWHGGVVMQFGFVLIVAVLAVVLIALYLMAMVSIYGTVGVLKESYAVFFYGSRYARLGDLLEPPEKDRTDVQTVFPQDLSGSLPEASPPDVI